MRLRLILLVLFAVSVYGVVYVAQRAAEKKATEEIPKPDAGTAGGTVAEVTDEASQAPVDARDRGETTETALSLERAPLNASEATSPDAASLLALAAPEPEVGAGRMTVIEGYVYARGEVVGGAEVSWRPAHDTHYVPPAWETPVLDREGIQHGAEADLTTQNPLNPGDSNPIRLGGGFRAYDVAMARALNTVPGVAYELSLDGRYAHGGWWRSVHGEGFNLDEQIGEFGIDLTGQTTDHESPTIEYRSVTDGPNNVWRRFRTSFTAEGAKTSVWLHATQRNPEIGCVWFDNLVVRRAGEESGVGLLPSAAGEKDATDEFFGSVATGASGFYRIEGIDPGEYDLLATCPGKGSGEKRRVSVRAGKTTTANFNLLGGGVIRGRAVENLTGEPIAGAVVTARLPVRSRERIAATEIPELRTTRTGNGGAFYLRGLLPGTPYHVTVTAPGYVPPRMQTVASDGPEATFALSPEGGVFGIVVEKGTEEPVEEAVVRVFSGPYRVAAAITDTEGRFAIGALKPGTYSVVAEKNGRKSSRSSGEATALEIQSPVEQVQLSLAIPRGSRLRGRAVDLKTKEPAAGIDFILTEHDPPNRRYSSDFEEFLADTSLAGLLEEVLLHEGTPEDIVTSDDDGVPGAREEGFFRSRFCVTTDQDGQFEVADIGPGSWRISLRPGGYAFARGTPTFVVNGGDDIDLQLELLSLPSVEGIVLDPERLPIEGVKVWAKSMRQGEGSYVTFYEEIGVGYSGPDGRFRIRGLLPEMEYGLVATARDGRMALVEGVKPDGREVEVIIEPSGSIEGEIHFESGKPLVGAKTTALGGEVFGIHWWRDGRTDGEGKFKMQHLPRGVYDLDFGTREPELRARYGPVRVDTAEEVTGLELVIPGHGKITGAVRFSDGSGAPGIVVTAARLDEEGKPKYPMHWVGIPPNPWEDDREPELDFSILVYQTLTDEAGEYVLDDLQPGVYQVKPSYPVYLAPHEMHGTGEAQSIEIAEEAISDVDFEMVEAPESEEEVPESEEEDARPTPRRRIRHSGDF